MIDLWGGTTWTGDLKCREVNLDFAERDKYKPVLLGLSLAGNLVKPLLSLYETEWRERGYGLWGIPINWFKSQLCLSIRLSELWNAFHCRAPCRELSSGAGEEPSETGRKGRRRERYTQRNLGTLGNPGLKKPGVFRPQGLLKSSKKMYSA